FDAVRYRNSQRRPTKHVERHRIIHEFRGRIGHDVLPPDDGAVNGWSQQKVSAVEDLHRPCPQAGQNVQILPVFLPGEILSEKNLRPYTWLVIIGAAGDQLTMDFKCLVAADEIVDRRAFVDEFEQCRPSRRGDGSIRGRAYPVSHWVLDVSIRRPAEKTEVDGLSALGSTSHMFCSRLGSRDHIEGDGQEAEIGGK